MALQSYHFAWLSKRTERDAEWLEAKLREGFDVHHLDGNHQNDDPDNLVLIESADHMDLHGFPMRRALAEAKEKAAPERLAARKLSARFEHGRQAYELKRAGLTWGRVGEAVGLGRRNVCATDTVTLAREYARLSDLPWPKPKSSLPGGFKGLKKVDGDFVEAPN